MHRHGGDSHRMQKRDLDAVFRKLAKRYLIPERNSVADLAFRLRTKPEEVEAQACMPPRDPVLLRNLSDAAKASIAYRPATMAGMALHTFRGYYREHGHIPGRDELRVITEQRWCKSSRSQSISKRQWRRVLRDDGLEELFAASL
jgi:hypothetical protein